MRAAWAAISAASIITTKRATCWPATPKYTRRWYKPLRRTYHPRCSPSRKRPTRPPSPLQWASKKPPARGPARAAGPARSELMTPTALPLLLDATSLRPLIGREDVLIIDLSQPQMHQQYHIPGANYLDYNRIVANRPPVLDLLPVFV